MLCCLKGWRSWHGGTGELQAMLTSSLWQLVIASGGGALFVLGILKFFGQKWIDSSIARGMESLRHKNIREIEEMKFEFQKNFDRRTRIIQFELEIIPKIWSLLLDATNKTKAAQARFRMHTDLTRLSEMELVDWLTESNVLKGHHAEIIKAQPADRNRLYSRSDDIRLCFEARKAASEARNLLAINAILIPSNLYEDFLAFSKMIDDAALDAETEAVHGRIPKEERRSDNFWTESDETTKTLSNKVRNLLAEGKIGQSQQNMLEAS
jgi:hypothetical protein